MRGIRQSVAALKQRTVDRLAAAYIAGPHLAEAIHLCRKIAENGWSSMICPWDGPEDTPETVASNYHLALKSIVRENLDCYLSVKVPALGYDIEKLSKLLQEARAHGVRVHFDSHHAGSASDTFTLLERGIGIHGDLGCTLPSRWRRSFSDAERAIDWGISIRVVKGQWPDPAEPGLDPTARFLDLIDVLRGRAAHVGVATHDASLAKEALLRLQRSGTPCQLEQLFGLPLHTISVTRPLGVSTRIYVAYGRAWLPYCISQVRRRPAMLLWMARDFFQPGFVKPRILI